MFEEGGQYKICRKINLFKLFKHLIKILSRLPKNGYTGLQNSLREKAMATHSSTLAWKIPWTKEPGRSRARLSDFTFTFHFNTLEKELATHSSVLAWRIPGTGEPGGLPSMGSHRVGHD